MFQDLWSKVGVISDDPIWIKLASSIQAVYVDGDELFDFALPIAFREGGFWIRRCIVNHRPLHPIEESAWEGS